MHIIPGPPPSAATPSAAPAQVHTVAVFRRIVLPDLAVIEPAGVSSAEVSRIAKVPGVRQVLALDGARLTMNGHQVSVLGVNAQQYRSWTPLSTASNQQLWNTLASGGFIATPQVHVKAMSGPPLLGQSHQPPGSHVTLVNRESGCLPRREAGGGGQPACRRSPATRYPGHGQRQQTASAFARRRQAGPGP